MNNIKFLKTDQKNFWLYVTVLGSEGQPTASHCSPMLDPRFLMDRVAMEEGLHPVLQLFLSISYHLCSTLIFIYTLLLRDWQPEEALETSRKQYVLEIEEHWVEKQYPYILGLWVRTMAQKVNRRLLIAKTRVPLWNGPSGICGLRSDIGTGFSPVTLILLSVSLHQPILIFIYMLL